MNRSKLFLSFFCLILVFFTSPVFAFGDFETTENKKYLITFKQQFDEALLKNEKVNVHKKYRFLPTIVAELSTQKARELALHPNILAVEPDGRLQAASQGVPWGISHVSAPEVHQLGYSGNGVKVGVLDTGIDYTHEDLVVMGGISFVPGVTDYMDDHGHGTQVAGIIGARDNSIGVVGVAPAAQLYAVKVLDRTGYGNYSDLIDGVEWCITNGIQVINMSLWGSQDSVALHNILDMAYQNGNILVSGAGNSGFNKKGNITYPAKYTSVIAVGSVEQSNVRASFSSVGKELEIMAPGVDILTTVIGNGYKYNFGTSMSSPFVAGAATLLKEKHTDWNAIQIRNAIDSSATSLGDSFLYGKGLLKIDAAIN